MKEEVTSEHYERYISSLSNSLTTKPVGFDDEAQVKIIKFSRNKYIATHEQGEPVLQGRAGSCGSPYHERIQVEKEPKALVM